mmetsp:Transcript_15199/g.43924  ORF Transcript_15199/g.43924 Transcript_15199/m.43924 type:complete len:213 (-) Transcript_15199:746-1384(-)
MVSCFNSGNRCGAAGAGKAGDTAPCCGAGAGCPGAAGAAASMNMRCRKVRTRSSPRCMVSGGAVMLEPWASAERRVKPTRRSRTSRTSSSRLSLNVWMWRQSCMTSTPTMTSTSHSDLSWTKPPNCCFTQGATSWLGGHSAASSTAPRSSETSSSAGTPEHGSSLQPLRDKCRPTSQLKSSNGAVSAAVEDTAGGPRREAAPLEKATEVVGR